MIELQRERDIDLLMKWREEVIENVFGEKPDTNLLSANRRYYENNIPNDRHVAYIAVKDGEEVGSGSICLSEELPSPDNLSGRCAYLMNIYVKSAFREKGIGHAIVAKLLLEAHKLNCGKIYLETTPEGRNVYESMGFVDMQDMMKLSSGKK